MKRIILNILCFTFCFISLEAQNPEGWPNETYIEGSFLLQLRDEDPAGFIKELGENGIEGVELQRELFPAMHIWLCTMDESVLSIHESLREIAALSSVTDAQLNHKIIYREFPDDEFFSFQWNLFNNGIIGLEDADIDATDAWDFSTGGVSALGDTIVLAVIDDGFDLDHDDLNFFVNKLEIASNAIDDDGNGYVDDILGWNAVSDSPNLPSSTHGTHVCGIAGAIGNNEIGISGINWDLSILPVYCDVEEANVIAAYSYVYEQRKKYDELGSGHGAFVVAVNASFGVDLAQPEDFPLWCAVFDTMGTLGILSVGATANSTINIDMFGDMPTACTSDFLITVTNTDEDDLLSTAAFGPQSIDVGAPGSSIYSTKAGNGYSFRSGTSMSAPHVSGLITLLFSAACPEFLEAYRAEPAAMALLAKQYILEGVDTIPSLQFNTKGKGRINANKTLLRLADNYCNSSDIPDQEPDYFRLKPFPSPADDYIHIGLSPAQTRTEYVLVCDMMGRNVLRVSSNNALETLDISILPPGIYALILKLEGVELPLTAKFAIK